MKYCLLNGSVKEKLKELPSDFFSTCVTSPPYWRQRNYDVEGQIGLEETPDEYAKIIVEYFRELKRVLKDDGTLWLNIGDSYASAPTGGISKKKSKWGFGRTHKTMQNALKRPSKQVKGIDDKNLLGIPWRVALGLQRDGWILRQDIIWQKTNPMTESVKDRCTSAHEYIFLFSLKPKYQYNKDAIAEDIYDKNNEIHKKNKRSVWKCGINSYKTEHIATYPIKLIEPCILAGSSKDEWVIDPFSGSGTTGVASLINNRNYCGIELKEDYVKESLKRLNQIEPLFTEKIDIDKLKEIKE